MINKDTKLLDGDGRKIPVTDFRKGENVKVTSEINNNVAIEVKKGLIEIRMGLMGF